MSLRPLYPGYASPSLPLALQRIARTPAARLAINYLLSPRRQLDCPLGVSLAVRQCRVPFPPVCYEPPCGVVDPFQIPLGEALYIDRLVTGGIIGTRLAILDRLRFPTERLEHWGAPTVGKNVDLQA